MRVIADYDGRSFLKKIVGARSFSAVRLVADTTFQERLLLPWVRGKRA